MREGLARRVEKGWFIGKAYQRPQLIFGAELVQCGPCGHPVTGERKTTASQAVDRRYVYYRCARPTSPGRPRMRTTEQELDRQILELFDRFER